MGGSKREEPGREMKEGDGKDVGGEKKRLEKARGWSETRLE